MWRVNTNYGGLYIGPNQTLMSLFCIHHIWTGFMVHIVCLCPLKFQIGNKHHIQNSKVADAESKLSILWPSLPLTINLWGWCVLLISQCVWSYKQSSAYQCTEVWDTITQAVFLQGFLIRFITHALLAFFLNLLQSCSHAGRKWLTHARPVHGHWLPLLEDETCLTSWSWEKEARNVSHVSRRYFLDAFVELDEAAAACRLIVAAAVALSDSGCTTSGHSKVATLTCGASSSIFTLSTARPTVMRVSFVRW